MARTTTQRPAVATAPPPVDAPSRHSFLTARALALGLLLSFLVPFVGTYLSMYVQGSNTGGGFFTNPLSHFVLFVLVGGANVALGAARRTWALGRGELVTIFILMTLGNQGIKIAFYWAPLLSGAYYHASAENDWIEVLHPLIPEWILPYQIDSLRAFYEATDPDGAAGLWQVWLGPFLHWLPMLVALHMAMLCMMIILRRQWSERERFIYPLIQVAGSMIEDDEEEALIKPFFRRPVMWVGFAIPFAIGTFQALHAYFPYIQHFDGRSYIALPGNVNLLLWLSIVALSLFFLIKLEVAFSLWVFTLIAHLQQSVQNVMGLADPAEPVLSAWNYGPPSVVHQSMGAMIVLVLGGLFVAREHLGNVFLKVVRGAPEVDDRDEVMSYRTAVFSLLASLIVLAFWLERSGIPLIGVLVFLFFAFVVFLALTRVVVEGGVAMLYTPLVPTDAALSALGTSFYGGRGVLGLTYCRIWAGDIFNFAMPHIANGLKLSEQIAGSRRQLGWAMLVAMIFGIVAGTAMLLFLTYNYGAINMSHGTFLWMARYVFDYAQSHIAEPVGPNWFGWLHTGIGAIIMGFLMFAQRMWLWWPLHPIGYPVSSVFKWMGYNAFLAWTLKSIMLKYGGPSLYNRIRPMFLGMIIGQFAIYGVFWVIDSITGMTGNYLMQ